MEEQQRKHNPFINSAKGGRLLSALQLPLFLIRPPSGYGVLTTIGRKTGKRRSRCVRAVRRGDKVVIVAIKGAGTGWLKNLDVNPEVRIRIRGGAFPAKARRVVDPAERRQTLEIYCAARSPFEYLEHAMWRRGRPTRERIDSLHRHWFEGGVPVVVDLPD